MLKSHLSSNIEVRQSPIQGKGIFAKFEIKKDDVIAIKSGGILAVDEFMQLSDQNKSACLQIEDDYFIGPSNEMDVEDSMIGFNHSCDSNAGFKGNIVCVAMRDIKVNEEITYDYATYNTKIFNQMNCDCNSNNCRNIITNNDWKNKDLQNKYKNYFQTYILNKFQ